MSIVWNVDYKKKGFVPIITVIFLLVIFVIGFKYLYSWYNNFENNLIDNTQQNNINNNYLSVEKLDKNILYIKNEYENLTIKDIKVGEKSCNFSTTLKKGLEKIDISNCFNNIDINSPKEIVLITNKKVISTVDYFNFGDYLNLTNVWNKTYGSAYDFSYTLKLDSNNNIYIAGYMIGSDKNFFLLKYDNNGNLVWNKTYDSGGDDILRGIWVGINYLYVIGDIDDGNDVSVLVQKYDLSGNLISNIIVYNDSYNNYGRDVALNSKGEIILLGYTNHTTNDIFLLKYDSAGNLIWNRTYDSGGDDRGYRLVLDLDDNIYLTGINENGSVNFYSAKYDTNGNLIWSKSFDYLGGGDYSYGICLDSNNNVIVAGHVDDSSNNNYFTIKYDNNGNIIWSRMYDELNYDSIADVAVDEYDNVYVTGGVSSDGSSDFKLVTIKYDVSGNFISKIDYSQTGQDFASSIEVDNNDNIIISGNGLDQIYNSGPDILVLKYK